MKDIPTPISDQWLKGYDDNEMTLDTFRVMQTLEKKLTAAREEIEMMGIRYAAAEMHHSNNIQEVTEQRDRLAEALKEILPLLPTASCDMFHHSKKDRHDYGDECKPLVRYNDAIKKAEEALMIEKAEK